MTEKLTYTPPEFAAVFGKERTWAYRQLYKGKVQAITELGRTLIPKSEVDRLLKEAGRYLGAKAKVGKVKAGTAKGRKESTGAKDWAAALRRRKAVPTKQSRTAGAADGRKTSSKARSGVGTPASSMKSVMQRLTRRK